MAKYIISDTHFNHGNIIENCDRPFDSEGEMNETMRERWNSEIEDGDVVYHLGDLALWSPEDEDEWIRKLNGEMMIIKGNHDSFNEYTEAPTVDSCVLKYDKYKFYCTHRPENVPDDWNHWVLYGHHHNNDLREFPFVDYENNRINLSVELIDYAPLKLEDLVEILGRRERIERLPDEYK